MKVPSEASKLVEYEFRDGGSMTASEFIANKHDILVTDDDISCIIDEHPEISATEASDFVVFLNCSDSYGSWMQRGIARRIRLGDPAELATFISVGSRFEVLRGCDPVNQYVQVFEILRAYATRDIDCVKAWIKRSTYPLASGHPDTRILYNAVLAIGHSDMDALGKAVDLMRNRTRANRWFKAAFRILTGISDDAPTEVSNGLANMLSARSLDAGMMLLTKYFRLEAHGLYRLAEQVNPHLVSSVAIDAELPWDREFHELTDMQSDYTPEVQLPDSVSPSVKSLMTLQPPDYFNRLDIVD